MGRQNITHTKKFYRITHCLYIHPHPYFHVLVDMNFHMVEYIYLFCLVDVDIYWTLYYLYDYMLNSVINNSSCHTNIRHV